MQEEPTGRASNADAPLNGSHTAAAQSLDELAALITARHGRSAHLLPDLALKMFGVQVLQYGRALLHLIDGGHVSWCFPLARTVFETAEDMAYLAFAPSQDEYDRLGALAMVGAEVSISKTNGLARAAGAASGLPPQPASLPERDRIKSMSDQWAAFRPGAEAIVESAYGEALEAWGGGVKHWSTLSRQRIHAALQERLGDPKLAVVLTSWYDILAARSHPGLHSPHMEWKGGHITFFTDGDAENPVPGASLRVALELAAKALQHQYLQWDAEVSESKIEST